jgi:DNA replication protein DnaC
MAEAGVAEEYRGCTFSRWSGAVPDPLVRYAALPDGFLLLLGAVGCGKTHLATAILAHHLESGGRGAWRDCQLLLSDMKRRGDDWRWADAEVSRLAAAQLVVLDDFGAERGTDYDLSTLAEIVRRRHAEGRPTVATSNLPLRASSAGGDDLYGREPRIASRLASGLVLELPGRDYRMSGGAR